MAHTHDDLNIGWDLTYLFTALEKKKYFSV